MFLYLRSMCATSRKLSTWLNPRSRHNIVNARKLTWRMTFLVTYFKFFKRFFLNKLVPVIEIQWVTAVWVLTYEIQWFSNFLAILPILKNQNTPTVQYISLMNDILITYKYVSNYPSKALNSKIDFKVWNEQRSPFFPRLWGYWGALTIYFKIFA